MNVSGNVGLIRVFLGLVLCLNCFGCDSENPESAVQADPSVRPFSDNLKEVVELFREVKFCTDEEAGVGTLKPLHDRMLTVLKSMPASIQQSGLSPNDQAKMTKSIQKAISACEASDPDNEAAYEKLCNDLKKPFKSMEVHCAP